MGRELGAAAGGPLRWGEVSSASFQPRRCLCVDIFVGKHAAVALKTAEIPASDLESIASQMLPDQLLPDDLRVTSEILQWAQALSVRVLGRRNFGAIVPDVRQQALMSTELPRPLDAL